MSASCKAMSRPCECTCLSEPFLVVYVISAKIFCAGPFECACPLHSEARSWAYPESFVRGGPNLIVFLNGVLLEGR